MANLKTLRARLKALETKRRSDSSVGDTKSPPPDWAGSLIAGDSGAYFLMEDRFATAYLHGGRPLEDVLSQSVHPDWVPELPCEADVRRWAYFDTETTGLAGGTGTVAFLIGIGMFEGQEFILRQYFLHDPGGESLLLRDAIERLASASAMVTFNGRAFDVPVLQTRGMLRLRKSRLLEGVPQFDLLPHARRFWRGRLESCSLGSLETAILGVQRTSDDIPGWAIPGLYREYLSTGNHRPLERVLYHNAQDVLSMVVLAAEMLASYSLPMEEMRDAGTALALARSLHKRGNLAKAEELYRTALALHEQKPALPLSGLTRLLKQDGRRTEALPYWRDWAAADPAAMEPCIELAKYFEWTAHDCGEALRWANAADIAATRNGGGHAPPSDWISRRLLRLERKLEKLKKTDNR